MQIKRKSELNHTVPGNRDKDSYPFALSAKVFHTEQLFLYSEQVRPGTKASAPHFHNAIDEIIYVTRGTLVAVEEEDEFSLSVGDCVCFKGGSKKKHYIENKSEYEAEFLILRRADIEADAVC